jgi:hypothetical protein
MENFLFTSPPTPLQLERGALLTGFTGVRRAARFVWVLPLFHERELPSPRRGKIGDGALAAKRLKLMLKALAPK